MSNPFGGPYGVPPCHNTGLVGVASVACVVWRHRVLGGHRSGMVNPTSDSASVIEITSWIHVFS